MKNLTLLFLLICYATETAFAQDSPSASPSAPMATLRGRITDAKTAEPLIGATIRIPLPDGKTVVTATNRNGRYLITLPQATYTLTLKYVGYRERSETLTLTADTEKNFTLEEGEIIASEIVVSAGEDLVTAVMRRAIRYKKSQRLSLKTYELDAYSKRLIKSDTSIAGITETFVKGYWREGDTLREVVVQERLTENIKSQLRGAGATLSASVGSIIDFSQERINIGGNRFISPIANNAFEYYSYQLIETKKAGELEYHRIKLIPKSKFVPLFKGEIIIGGYSFALVSVEVVPSEGFKIPLVSDLVLKYRQTQELYTDSAGNAYWLPATQLVDGVATVSVAGGLITIPRFAFTQTTAIYAYRLNTSVSDSVFEKKRVTKADTADRYDSTFWAKNQIVARTEEEETAYRTIDSTDTFESRFQPRGAGGANILSTLSQTALRFVDFRYNRVEGYFFGGRLELDSLTATTGFNARLGYGIERKEWLFNVGVEQWLQSTRRTSVGVDVYRNTAWTPENNPVLSISNTINAILFKYDYHNYFNAEGFRAFVRHKFRPRLALTLTYTNEDQRSMAKTTDYSWLFQNTLFRDNPPVADGTMRSVELELYLGDRTGFTQIGDQTNARVAVEHSSPRLLSSDFDFTRINAAVLLRRKTFFTERLLAPFLILHFDAGITLGAEGALPPQRYFSIESGGTVSPLGTMFAAGDKSYVGDRMLWSLVEHNFQSVPFEALGIDFVSKANIQLITRAGMGTVWRGSNQTLYWEAGVGVGNLFNIIRLDWLVRRVDTEPFSARLVLTGGIVF